MKRKNVEGVEFDFWIGDATGRDWYDLQSTDPDWRELRFIRDHMIEVGEVILEAGAHHGCATVVLSRWVGDSGRIVAFEPQPKNCTIVAKNIELNRLTNARLEVAAVGAVSGRVLMRDESNASVANEGFEARLVTLDEYADFKPTFLEIDVEGFEVEVLKGTQKLLCSCPKLAIEVHTENLLGYGTSVEHLLSLIPTTYALWVQWKHGENPQPYDRGTPITQRVHLFGVPRATAVAGA